MFFNSPQTEAAVSAGTTAAQITTKSDPSFVGFLIQSTDNAFYWGDSTVSSTNGQLASGSQPIIWATKNPANFWVRTASGTADVRVTLFKGFR